MKKDDVINVRVSQRTLDQLEYLIKFYDRNGIMDANYSNIIRNLIAVDYYEAKKYENELDDEELLEEI